VSERQNHMGKWKYHLDYILKSDSLNDDDKREILDGLAKLRDVFTDEWLWEAAKGGHPLISYITNYAPWSQLWLAELGRRLNSLEALPNFGELKKRLLNPKEYAGAIAEVDLVYKLTDAGYVVELYPQVGTKKADMKALLSDKEVFFEVTNLQPTLKSIKASETFDQLTFPYTFNHDIIIQCQIHKILSEPHINELRIKIEEAIAEVKETKDFVYIGEPNVIDYLILYRDKQDDLDSLVSKYGMKREVSGPPIPVDDVRRLESRIWEKINQLPKDEPSVIVIYGNITYFFSKAEEYYSKIAYDIEEAVYSQGNLVAGIIIGGEAGMRDADIILQKPNFVFIRNTYCRLLSQSILIINNKYSLFPFKDKLAEELVSVFKKDVVLASTNSHALDGELDDRWHRVTSWLHQTMERLASSLAQLTMRLLCWMRQKMRTLVSLLVWLAIELATWSWQKARAAWRQGLKRRYSWVYIVSSVLLLPALTSYAFSSSWQLGLSFLWSAFIAIYFAYIFRHPFLLILVYVGVITGKEFIGLFVSAKDVALQGDLISASILVLLGIFLTVWANRIKSGEVFQDVTPKRRRDRRKITRQSRR